ncbi:MAG: hypothetical protein ACK4NY_18080 [Spirosomataceae bacterium]
MKIIFKIFILSVTFSTVYGQGISVEPSRIRFSPVLSVSPFSDTDPSLQIFSSHPTSKPSLTFRHLGRYNGTITSDNNDNFTFYTNYGYRFQTNINFNYVDALTILNDGRVGIGTNPSQFAKLDVDGNIRSSSLDFVEQASTERRMIFADANGVIRADNSTNQFQSYNFSAVHSQDYNDQLRKGSGFAWFNTTNTGATMYLPVNLPDGVKVTNVRMFAIDDSASDLIFTFSRNNHLSNSFTTIASAQTTGANTNMQFIESTSNETIQNQNNSYYLNISSVGNWIGNNLRFHSLVITYQYQ